MRFTSSLKRSCQLMETHSRVKSFLGLCRKAGKLQSGHDAVKVSIKQGKARLIILSCDASERLQREMERLAGDINIIRIKLTMDDIASATGKRAGVISINDEGFALKLSDETTKEGLLYDDKIQSI